jgi:hypothetical protein
MPDTRRSGTRTGVLRLGLCAPCDADLQQHGGTTRTGSEPSSTDERTGARCNAQSPSVGRQAGALEAAAHTASDLIDLEGVMELATAAMRGPMQAGASCDPREPSQAANRSGPGATRWRHGLQGALASQNNLSNLRLAIANPSATCTPKTRRTSR